jgi:iron complex outermembrane recepter protein
MKYRAFSMMLIAFATHVSFAQNFQGNILNDKGENLVGATISLTNSFINTSTDVNGLFKVSKLKKGTHYIKIVYVGYETLFDTIYFTEETIHKVYEMKQNTFNIEELTVEFVRVKQNAPFSFTNVTADEIASINLAQDIPILLQSTPSLVATSDAGAGVGYTGFRIRGSDGTRINVTVNGIPLNDSESHGVWWVNMPDFASSVDNIQIQRGVGTSTNGAGAFGASVNLQTNSLNEKPYAELNNTYGSFNTRKHQVKFGTGLLSNNWAFDGRWSMIKSDGYIDRAYSDLTSYYLSAGYYGKNNTLKIIHFSGKEKTYQSWWGTPQSRIENDEQGMLIHAMNNGLDSSQTANLLNAGRTYNYYEYENETDNYQQDHYQIHYNHQLNKKLYFVSALHYTYGRGYYEQFRKNDRLSRYGLPPSVGIVDTIYRTDIVRQRWLDNHFGGVTYNLKYEQNNIQATLGGGYNIYNGDHFGEIIWARNAGNTFINHRYYDNNAVKNDLNQYLKVDVQLNEKTEFYADFQIRHILYKAQGIDNNQQLISIDTSYLFFNPKIGLNYLLNSNARVFASYSVANREPVRSDFIDATLGNTPKHETLHDLEIGFENKFKKGTIQTNLYYMNYFNQLIVTGELNDVGAVIRKNVDKSYRAGIELIGKFSLTKSLFWDFNLTLSQNKIKNFTEVVYDYTNGYDIIENHFTNTDMALSPNIIGFNRLTFNPIKSFFISFQSKYVGQQYLDNTSSQDRKIDAYLISDVNLSYKFKVKKLEELSVNLLVNNVFNQKYSSNGYTYNYVYENLIVENFYYPQAGINYLLGLTIKL